MDLFCPKQAIARKTNKAVAVFFNIVVIFN
jgi:hypothetical protein